MTIHNLLRLVYIFNKSVSKFKLSKNAKNVYQFKNNLISSWIKHVSIANNS